MALLGNENLFLLEFLVDDLKMEGRCDCMSAGGLCVSFQFLDNEALDVCEGDFNGGMKFGENGTSKTGKSCLFSLTPAQAQNVLSSFDLIVSVFKRMRPGSQPEKISVGSAKISVLPLFLDLIGTTEAATTAKVLQETYNLIDSKNATVGKIGVYIRMSCYGKMIITQFQMNMDDKSVLFKDKDGHSLYRYKKSKKGKATKIEDLSQKNQCPPECPNELDEMSSQMCPPMNQPMYGPGQYPGNPNCPMQPCFPNSPGGFAGGFPPSPFALGGGFPPSMGPPMQPGFQSNQNCPMQPCFPDYGQQDVCPDPSKACQQVSFSQQKRQPKSACCGGCGRG